MTTPQINDNGINRDMTAREAAEYNAWADEQKALLDAQQKAEKERAANRSAALKKLGLTEAEIAALFGQ